MALNLETKYPGRITASDANYDYGSSKDETAPGAGDGTPYEEARANDVFGIQQALLKISWIVPSGNADTQIASQYLQALIELAMGRATNYDESGAAEGYELEVQTNQQAPARVFDGMIADFIVGNTNTGASTVNLAGLGVKDIVGTSDGGELTAGERVKLRYRTSSGDFEIVIAPVSVLPDFQSGLELSNAADADHDITMAAGQATDSTNAFSLSLSSALTKQIDAAWAVGDAAGGLFSGTVAADTFYHIFVIRKDSDGSIDVGYDVSITAANIPAGYTAFRRRGYLKTDSGANISTLISIDTSSKTVQVVTLIDGAVATGTTVIPYDDTIPQNTEGNEFMTLDIIPTDIDNILVIDSIVNMGWSSSERRGAMVLFQDSVANALAADFCTRDNAADEPTQVSMRHVMVAGTVIATTMKIRAGTDAAGTVTFNGVSGGGKYGGVMASSITITEYKA